MSFTQFSMVEELASLVRDNLPCKHLVLSVEEALVNLLQDETSSDEVLELEPMNPYNRLLIHRVADIFGFSHHSVGEGDERHIVLQRCPDSTIPSMLVSDLLWEYDEVHYERLSDVHAKPSESSPGLNLQRRVLEFSLEDREEAYLAARERIFSVDDYETGGALKQRPPKNPVVARRMIVHALGRQAKSSTENVLVRDCELEDSDSGDVKMKQKDSALSTEKSDIPEKHLNSYIRQKVRDGSSGSSHSGTRLPLEKVDKTCTKSELFPIPRTERCNYDIEKEKNEHVGAARRIFANALGIQRRNGNVPKSSLKRETME